jgi:hypothetical protein
MLRASVAQAFRPEDFSCGGMVGGGARSLIPKGMSTALPRSLARDQVRNGCIPGPSRASNGAEVTLFRRAYV